MISADCDAIRDALDAFVDGELRGEELRLVAAHLDGCRLCAAEVEDRRALGGLIRESLSAAGQRPLPDGLAPGVVARVRAESAQSWRAGFSRAVEDWHWVIVGGGAVTATFMSTLFCSALLVLGTLPPRPDSLSALSTNLSSPAGTMFAEVSPSGTKDPSLMLVEIETSAEPGSAWPATPLTMTRGAQERSWVDALGATIGSGGPLTQLSSMNESDRRRTEWLLDNITRLRGAEPVLPTASTLQVHRLHLVTNTSVTAKGLTP
jgi:hypothetical protein